MSNNKLTTKSLLSRTDVQAKFAEMLGKKSQGFLSSVLQINSVNSTEFIFKKLLQSKEPCVVRVSAPSYYKQTTLP